MIIDVGEMIGKVVKNTFGSIPKNIPELTTILPIKAKCLNCGHRFTPTLVGRRCPECGSYWIQIDYRPKTILGKNKLRVRQTFLNSP